MNSIIIYYNCNRVTKSDPSDPERCMYMCICSYISMYIIIKAYCMYHMSCISTQIPTATLYIAIHSYILASLIIYKSYRCIRAVRGLSPTSDSGYFSVDLLLLLLLLAQLTYNQVQPLQVNYVPGQLVCTEIKTIGIHHSINWQYTQIKITEIAYNLSRYGSIRGVNRCQNFVKVTSNIGNLVTNSKIVIVGLSKTFNLVVWTKLASYMNVKVYIQPLVTNMKYFFTYIFFYLFFNKCCRLTLTFLSSSTTYSY